MKFTLGQAAKQTGKGKGTLSRDLNTGKMSGERMPDGSWQIDASELFRVYPRVTQDGTETGSGNPVGTDPKPSETPLDTERLRAELGLLRERMQMAGQMHEKELDLLNDRIEELRQDRQDLRGERDSLLATLKDQAQTVRLLTDQSTKAPPPAAPPPAPGQPSRRSLFSFFRRPAA